MGIPNRCGNCGCEPPGPPSCPCFTDDFNRADSTNLGSDWTETSGSWSISSNRLTLSSPSNGDNAQITPFTPLPPTAGSCSRIQCTLSGSSGGDKPGVLVRYTDASN